jgi:two-component system chemotaxis response regulator CheY
MGNEVEVASDGAEAWEMLEAAHSPLVITDWMMPNVDGLELCRRIRTSGQERYTYVILLTSRDCHQDRLVGLRAGADDFLIKPPDQEELAVRLEIAQRILQVHETLCWQNARLVEMATTDELTGVKNRRRFREDIEAHLALAGRQHLPLSLVMLDVDHFKKFNDVYGHQAGDRVLRRVAGILREGVRIHDVVARYGGEEFVILLPATDANRASDVAERLRRTIEEASGTPGAITASLGVTTFDGGDCDIETLVERADRALYHAKQSGRNRVCLFHLCIAESRLPSAVASASI